MPITLKETEDTLYPTKDVRKRRYDPYHTYFVIRKDLQGATGCTVGILKDIKGKFYICYLDGYDVEEVELERVAKDIFLTTLTKKFDVIELDNDEYSTSNGRGCDFSKKMEMHFDIIRTLTNEVKMKAWR